jgi:hypothetical protein
MSLITLVLTLIIIGILLWAVNTYIPMAAPIKKILNAVVVIAVILYIVVLVFGGLGNLPDIRISK